MGVAWGKEKKSECLNHNFFAKMENKKLSLKCCKKMATDKKNKRLGKDKRRRRRRKTEHSYQYSNTHSLFDNLTTVGSGTDRPFQTNRKRQPSK